MGNVFVERLWRSVEARGGVPKGIRECGKKPEQGLEPTLSFYNNERPHQALERRTPAKVFEEGRNQVHQPELSATPGWRRPNNGLER